MASPRGAQLLPGLQSSGPGARGSPRGLRGHSSGDRNPRQVAGGLMSSRTLQTFQARHLASQTVVITSPLWAAGAPGLTAGVCLGSVRRHCPAANTPSRMSKINKAPAILHTTRLHQEPTSCPALPLPGREIYSPRQLWSSLTTSACWGVWRRTSPQGHSAARGLQPPDF